MYYFFFRTNLFKIDGNVFLRDEAHAGHQRLPSYNTTSNIDITNIPHIYKKK